MIQYIIVILIQKHNLRIIIIVIIKKITNCKYIQEPYYSINNLKIIQSYLYSWNYYYEIPNDDDNNTINDFILFNWLISEIDIFNLYIEYTKNVFYKY